ncbi:MAG: hypothetical protein CSA23_08120 [Deltaproteobacteria bacterium]|nr:MAG: hypothetical protein CSA23_08120 [Deltaproteobacteria bacterium]
MATDAEAVEHSAYKPGGFSLITALAVLSLFMSTMPSLAWAYVLEAPHVLELTARAMGRIASLEVSQKLLVYAQEPDDAPTVFDETAIYIPPERFRSDLASDGIQRTHLVFGNSSLTLTDGRLSQDQNPLDAYQHLLRSRTRKHLMRTLHRLKVETAISSLGRLDNSIVFVIGARYPDESVSQLAVNKETFLPARLLLVDGENGQQFEIVYQNWQRHRKAVFPYHILFYINGRLDREIRVVNLRLNPSVPADKMDLEALRTQVVETDAVIPQPNMNW